MNWKDPLWRHYRRILLPAFTVGVSAVALFPVSLTAHAPHQKEDFPVWFQSVWNQASRIVFDDVFRRRVARIPEVIPQNLQQPDETGTVATYQSAGTTFTAGHSFFSPLGTNGRTCFSCHQPQAGWSMNPASAQAIFIGSAGTDPLFAPIDGSNCPDMGQAAKSLEEKALASSQLLTKANFRIFLPVPADAQFKVRILRDPYGCENHPQYGLPSGVLSMYRRALNATNLTRNAVGGPLEKPQGDLMWDGREPSLESQFRDAVLGHAQGTAAPSDDQIAQGVEFEAGLFTAQSIDRRAGDLSAQSAGGGPLGVLLIGPSNVATAPTGFTQYTAWLRSNNPAQASIARGETLFNTRSFAITGVAGLNDLVGANVISGTCASCHSSMNVGSDALGGLKHLGIGDNSSYDWSARQGTGTTLPPTSDQPLFAFYCPVGSIPYFSNPVTIRGKQFDEYRTTDPGLGLLTGQCADLGKFKVPRLSGLASRAPYFHNGNAASLKDVVEFYDNRFGIGLTEEQKQDLIHFLQSL